MSFNKMMRLQAGDTHHKVLRFQKFNIKMDKFRVIKI
jgi:hypothetical protein